MVAMMMMMMMMMITKHQYDSVLLQDAQSRRSDNVLKTIKIDVPIDVPKTVQDAQYRRTDNV